MSETGALTLSGAVLRSHYDWLLAHAKTGKDGQLYCRTTGEADIGSHVNHRYRLDAGGHDAPFVLDIMLGNTGGSGRMISFASFGCRACNNHPPVPDSVLRSDVVHLNRGNIEP